MTTYHPLLLRQLKRLGVDATSPGLSDEQCTPLLERISRAYEDADKSQYLLRRAQELSAQEIGQLYIQLKEAQRIAGFGNWTYHLGEGRGQWSEECARLFGIEMAARMPNLRSLLRRLHARSRKAFLEALKGAIQSGREFELELRLVPPAGGPGWMHIAGQPVREDDGTVRTLHGTVMDITRRKQTELWQSVEHKVTKLLAEAASPIDVMPQIVEAIGGALGWACGGYWRWDAARDSFQRLAAWSSSRPRVASFVAASGDTVRRESGGLIAQTAQRCEPVLVTDAGAQPRTHDPSAADPSAADPSAVDPSAADPSAVDPSAADPPAVDPSAADPSAVAAGLHTAFAFPAHAGGQIAGVFEFFDTRTHQMDEDLLESAKSLGRLTGQFLQRKQVEEYIHQLAFHDTLTNLPNRAMFNRQLSHAIAHAARYNRRLAVLFIDLDRFKLINDALGHDAGDRLLQEMARRLSASLRRSDMVSRLDGREGASAPEVIARLGGDEFVVLMEEITDVAHVGHVARKLLSALVAPCQLEGHPVHITASIGAAIYPQDGLDERTLMKHADIAMYRAKEAGKNKYQFYSAEMNEHSRAMLALDADLRAALLRGELRLYYQAKFDMLSGRINGAEALVRWQHPTLGLLTSAQFIPLAEDTGLIIPLGKWVLERACHQSRAWQKAGLPPLRVAVNLSARQFSDEHLLTDIAMCLSRTRMDPALLELEITESTMMQNPDKVVYVLHGLKEMGVRVAIDDFGVGYSSLAQLKRLPIDIIKVDRSFIQDCPDDAADVAITNAVIGIGKSLDLQVVAEGVETARQLRFLRRSGCHEIQGYLVSPPVSADEFATLYRKSLAGPYAMLRRVLADQGYNVTLPPESWNVPLVR
jgi:predicted signal transduction protein with EAL and GGDEF domain/PAS domain-containing protein